MIFLRSLFLFFVLTSLAAISGCSEGEVIPLIPPSVSCERPLDPSWKSITNICKDRQPRDVLWPAGEVPVIVGTSGLILEKPSNAGWSVIDLRVQDDLLVLSDNSDGDMMAVGRNGAIVTRINGTWRVEEKITTTDWNDVRSDGREMWLAGDGGHLARGIPGGLLQMVDYPDSTDIYSVCVAGDSVFVGGQDGLLRVMVDNQWHDISWMSGVYNTVTSMILLDDGRLALWAGSFWVREPDGWNIQSDLGYSANRHLKLRDGFVWLVSGYRTVLRADPSTEPWSKADYTSSTGDPFVAPGEDGRALVVDIGGAIHWMSLDAQGELINRLDPEGHVDTKNLFCLGDQTIICPTSNGLFKVTHSRIEQVPIQSSYLESQLSSSILIAGASLEDFYLAQYSRLWRVLNGELVLEEDFPNEYGHCQNILINDEGLLCASFPTGILFWHDNQWEVWDEGNSNRIFLTQYQNFVAVFASGGALYRTGSSSVSLELPMRANLAWEPEPGTLEFMDGDYAMVQWRLGAPSSELVYQDPLPGCTNLYIRALSDTPVGALMASNSHSMIFRIPNDPYLADWDLVAGPCLSEIERIQIMGSGALVALARRSSTIMIYPTPGY